MLRANIPQLPPGDRFWTGPERVDFPTLTAPVVSSPGATLPTPPLPSPPSPILPAPGIEIADEFQFDEMVLGNPGSPAEALAFLEIEVFQAPPMGGSHTLACATVEPGIDGGFRCEISPQPEISLDPMG